MAKVGFIGLGTMGDSMAYNALRGGNGMVVHDIRREVATRHLEAGAVWADTPREVAEASDIVFTSLPGPVEVDAVALGEDGLVEGLSRDKVYFDLSTNSPTPAPTASTATVYRLRSVPSNSVSCTISNLLPISFLSFRVATTVPTTFPTVMRNRSLSIFRSRNTNHVGHNAPSKPY